MKIVTVLRKKLNFRLKPSKIAKLGRSVHAEKRTRRSEAKNFSRLSFKNKKKIEN